ncbi:SAV_2336 N-terminal domain-related protein [Streptomyces sp. NBC_01304]|uniref:SAV_2336 N-terminal domain-related protein n=1 Tax=Streptomyces sp. NBC_01304 TaxID=2903818 RepID=UPI002E122713|nr:SAV_2336 family protein [Streptomyces sp. NBC_01304]
MNSATPHGPADPADLAAVTHLNRVLAAVGLDFGPRELSELLWLARQLSVRAPDADVPDVPVPLFAPAPDVPVLAYALPPAPALAPGAVARPAPVEVAEGAPGSVYGITTPVPGRGAAPVRIPSAPGLQRPLDVARALRPLGRTAASSRRLVLDEVATAESIADNGVFDLVLRPERARWLDLVVALDDGLSLRVWQDTSRQLAALLAGFGIFRSVRGTPYDPGSARRTTPVDGLVTAPARTVVLVVSDGVGEGWRSGEARRHLARWARLCHTAVLDPLPARLWPRTGLNASRLTVRSRGLAPAARAMYARDTLLPRRLAPPLGVPVPVLELVDWELRPWAELVARDGGTARLRVIDAARQPEPRPKRRRALPATPEQRLLSFRDAVSTDAYTLAGHLASIDPLTLPVMRVVQAAVAPGSSPACLAEVLLGGLMRVEPALDGKGGRIAYDAYGFAPEMRELLMATVSAADSRRTVAEVSRYITPRLGQRKDFPALVATPEGTFQLPPGKRPFAKKEVPEVTDPALDRLVLVSGSALPPRTGYLVGNRLVLTVLPAVFPARVGVRVEDPSGRAGVGDIVWQQAMWGLRSPLVALVRTRGDVHGTPVRPVDWGGLRASGVRSPADIAWCGRTGGRTARGGLRRDLKGGPQRLVVVDRQELPGGVEDAAPGVLVFSGGALAGVSPNTIAPGNLPLVETSAFSDDPDFRAVLSSVREAAPALHNLPALGDDDSTVSEAAKAWLDLSYEAGEEVCTLYGQGLSGKSATALWYAHEHLAEYELVWWLDAARGIEPSVRLARQLVTHAHWLLVLDGAQSGAEALRLSAAYPRGRILMTARRGKGLPTNTYQSVRGESVAQRAEPTGPGPSRFLGLLAWLGPRVDRRLFEPLRHRTPSAYHIDSAAQALHAAGLARLDPPGEWSAVRTAQAARVAMRALYPWAAAAELLAAHGEGDDALIAPYVLALSCEVPPREDTPALAELYHRAALHLVGEGDPEGVLLAERARQATPGRDLAKRWLIVESALRRIPTALALAPGQVEELEQGGDLPGLLRRLTRADEATGEARVDYFQDALDATVHTLGRAHPLVAAIRAELTRLSEESAPPTTGGTPSLRRPGTPPRST